MMQRLYVPKACRDPGAFVLLGDVLGDGEIVKVGHRYGNGSTNVWLRQADGGIRKNRLVSAREALRIRR